MSRAYSSADNAGVTSVVLFDLGGVVCRFEPAPRLDRLAALSGLPPREVLARVWESGLAADFDRGDYSTEQWRAAVNERLGLALNAETFEDVILSPLAVDHDVLAVVDALDRRRVRVAMLTDNPPLLFDAIARRFPELVPRFDPMLFSFQLGVLKPTEEAFRHALDRLGADASDVLFVDDTPVNVEAAAALGLNAVQFTSAAALLDVFRTAGLLQQPAAVPK